MVSLKKLFVVDFFPKVEEIGLFLTKNWKAYYTKIANWLHFIYHFFISLHVFSKKSTFSFKNNKPKLDHDLCCLKNYKNLKSFDRNNMILLL